MCRADGTTEIAISAVTVDEIAFGLSWRPTPRVATWFDRFLASRCTVLPITAEIARVSGDLRGRLMAEGKPHSQADMMIAATARVHGLIVVTRNVRHFDDCGVSVLNPFS